MLSCHENSIFDTVKGPSKGGYRICSDFLQCHPSAFWHWGDFKRRSLSSPHAPPPNLNHVKSTDTLDYSVKFFLCQVWLGTNFLQCQHYWRRTYSPRGFFFSHIAILCVAVICIKLFQQLWFLLLDMVLFARFTIFTVALLKWVSVLYKAYLPPSEVTGKEAGGFQFLLCKNSLWSDSPSLWLSPVCMIFWLSFISPGWVPRGMYENLFVNFTSTPSLPLAKSIEPFKVPGVSIHSFSDLGLIIFSQPKRAHRSCKMSG